MQITDKIWLEFWSSSQRKYIPSDWSTQDYIDMNIPEMTMGLLIQTFFFDKGDYSFMDLTQNQIPLICYLG